MLRDIDKQMIKAEESTLGFNQKLIPIDFSPYQILNHYDVHEFTEHWYDSDAEECDHCERCVAPDYCKDCEIWEAWKDSDERLRHNTWIDVWGAGIWGMSQKKCNRLVRRVFEGEIYKDGAWRERLFCCRPDDSDYIYLFYYNRDRNHYDYWFIFKKKGGK